MKVWIDADLCTGVALCVGASPEVFAMGRDGVAHVVDLDGALLDSRVPAAFRDDQLESVIEAAEDCPEQCIFIET